MPSLPRTARAKRGADVKMYDNDNYYVATIDGVEIKFVSYDEYFEYINSD